MTMGVACAIAGLGQPALRFGIEWPAPPVVETAERLELSPFLPPEAVDPDALVEIYRVTWQIAERFDRGAFYIRQDAVDAGREALTFLWRYAESRNQMLDELCQAQIDSVLLAFPRPESLDELIENISPSNTPFMDMLRGQPPGRVEIFESEFSRVGISNPMTANEVLARVSDAAACARGLERTRRNFFEQANEANRWLVDRAEEPSEEPLAGGLRALANELEKEPLGVDAPEKPKMSFDDFLKESTALIEERQEAEE